MNLSPGFDDVVVLDSGKEQLKAIRDETAYFLKTQLGLTLNHKTRIARCRAGVDFVGRRIWATKMKLRKSTARRIRKRLRTIRRRYTEGSIDAAAARDTVVSYLGLMRHADAGGLAKQLLAEPFARVKLACVKRERT